MVNSGDASGSRVLDPPDKDGATFSYRHNAVPQLRLDSFISRSTGAFWRLVLFFVISQGFSFTAPSLCLCDAAQQPLMSLGEIKDAPSDQKLHLQNCDHVRMRLHRRNSYKRVH